MLFILAAVVVLLFGFVVAFGAPYLPTLQPRTQDALKLLALKPGQTMLELGCGDGRVLRAAAQQGIKAVGYELNPLLVIVAKMVTWRYRRLVTVRWGDYWRVTLPPCDGVYVFLLDRYMSRLDEKIAHEAVRPIQLVSFAFEIPGRKPTKHKNGLFLYRYPSHRG